MTSPALRSPRPDAPPVLPDVLALCVPAPPASLEEARAGRDGLARLLGREQHAAADFLLALADFDRRRAWERLGHASLFAFLTRELAPSKGAAYLRLTAARLLPRFPAVEAALRSGRLCLSAVGELARVVTEENQDEVLPRFAGCSAREAREVAASIRPVAAAPVREVITRIDAGVGKATGSDSTLAVVATVAPPAPLAPPPGTHIARPEAATLAPRPCEAVLTSEPPLTQPARDVRATAEPLTAELRRLHLTVSRSFLEKVERARHGQSHTRPDATMEQVLETALDLLLERQARRKALVRRSRATVTPTSTSISTPTPTPTSTSTPSSRRPHIPAAVERTVRHRDGDRCRFPFDAGGVCGSTWRVELDHITPLALGGATSVENLRCLCARHNRCAAETLLGGAARQRRGRRRAGD